MNKQLIDKLNKIKFDLAIYENEAEKFSVSLSDKITKTYLEVARLIELIEIQQLPEPIKQKECEIIWSCAEHITGWCSKCDNYLNLEKPYCNGCGSKIKANNNGEQNKGGII